MEEFNEVVHQMHPNKTPGPGKLIASFYHNFWEDCGRHVYDACKMVLDDE